MNVTGLKLVMLPVWIGTWRYKGEPLRLLVNAQTAPGPTSKGRPSMLSSFSSESPTGMTRTRPPSDRKSTRRRRSEGSKALAASTAAAAASACAPRSAKEEEDE